MADITLGVEVEFEIRNPDWDLIYPDKVNIRGYGWKTSPIGVDGANNIAEIRTKPGTPKEVADHAYTLYHKLLRKCSSYGYIATPFSYSTPTGLHIHFGFSDGSVLASIPTRILERWVNIMMTVGKLHVNWNPIGRAQTVYTSVENYRTQQWGIEYRALPATLISSPLHFRRTLEFAKLAANAALYDLPVQYPDWWDKYVMRAEQGPPANKIPEQYRKLVKPDICFSLDVWTPSLMELTKEIFLNSRVIKSLQRRSLVPVKIFIVGLRKERGICYGSYFQLPVNIPRVSGLSYPPTYIGIPWEYRNDPKYKHELETLLKAFINTLGEQDSLPAVFTKRKRSKNKRKTEDVQDVS